MNKHIRLIPALALGMAGLAIPTLATAATTINVVEAFLVAKSAGALVSVEVTCDPSFGPGSHLFLNVSLVQRAGSRVTQGFGFINDTTINCDGTPQTFQGFVITGGKIFHQGPAIAQASESVYNPDFSQGESAQVTEEIQLVRQ